MGDRIQPNLSGSNMSNFDKLLTGNLQINYKYRAMSGYTSYDKLGIFNQGIKLVLPAKTTIDFTYQKNGIGNNSSLKIISKLPRGSQLVYKTSAIDKKSPVYNLNFVLYPNRLIRVGGDMVSSNTESRNLYVIDITPNHDLVLNATFLDDNKSGKNTNSYLAVYNPNQIWLIKANVVDVEGNADKQDYYLAFVPNKNFNLEAISLEENLVTTKSCHIRASMFNGLNFDGTYILVDNLDPLMDININYAIGNFTIGTKLTNSGANNMVINYLANHNCSLVISRVQTSKDVLPLYKFGCKINGIKEFSLELSAECENFDEWQNKTRVGLNFVFKR